MKEFTTIYDYNGIKISTSYFIYNGEVGMVIRFDDEEGYTYCEKTSYGYSERVEKWDDMELEDEDIWDDTDWCGGADIYWRNGL